MISKHPSTSSKLNVLHLAIAAYSCVDKMKTIPFDAVPMLCVLCTSFFQFSQRGLSDDNHTHSFSVHESLVLAFFTLTTLCAVLICGVSSNKYSNSTEINYALHLHIRRLYRIFWRAQFIWLYATYLYTIHQFPRCESIPTFYELFSNLWWCEKIASARYDYYLRIYNTLANMSVRVCVT